LSAPAWAALGLTGVLGAVVLALVTRLGGEAASDHFSFRRCLVFLAGAHGALAVRRWSVVPSNISTRWLGGSTVN
jgi:hypothetical protein